MASHCNCQLDSTIQKAPAKAILWMELANTFTRNFLPSEKWRSPKGDSLTRPLRRQLVSLTRLTLMERRDRNGLNMMEEDWEGVVRGGIFFAFYFSCFLLKVIFLSQNNELHNELNFMLETSSTVQKKTLSTAPNSSLANKPANNLHQCSPYMS